MTASIDTVASIAVRGRESLSADLHDHIALGAGTNTTIASNRAGWDALTLNPRVLTGAGRVEPATSLFGIDLSMPVILAPVGPLELIHPDGAIAASNAAHGAGIAAIVAITSSPSFAEVAGASNGPLLAQIYWWGDRSWVAESVSEISTAGYKALVVTVDAPAYAVREHDILRGYSHHDRMQMPNLANAPGTQDDRLAHQASSSWADIAWLTNYSDLPIIVKGITNRDDARRAVDSGASGVYVSNHGGRILDHMPPTSAVLPSISDAVDVPVIVDGGIESAADVAKAISLGADAVAIGRLQCWGLADPVSGLEGLLHALHREIADTMTIMGEGSTSDRR